jgi:hypothetical protein
MMTAGGLTEEIEVKDLVSQKGWVILWHAWAVGHEARFGLVLGLRLHVVNAGMRLDLGFVLETSMYYFSKISRP